MSDIPGNYEILITAIQKEFGKPLPGKSSQYRMAPADRDRRYAKITSGIKPKQAGVMLLLFPSSGQLSIVFVKRTIYPGAHSGQISLPGGTFSFEDASVFQTAIRETEEELGINLNNIVKVGALSPLFISISNFMVFPFVGFIDKMPPFRVQKMEVQFAFTESLSVLQSKNILGAFKLKRENDTITAPCYLVKKEKIWGATAMILSEFLTIWQNSVLNLEQ